MLRITSVMTTGLLSLAAAQLTNTRAAAPAGAPPARPSVILVRDFELDAANVRSEPNLVRPPILGHTRVGGVLHGRSPCAGNDAAACAAEIQELVATSLVEDLNRAGLAARRIGAADPLPTAGWLVRGVFTDVDTGNQLHRAVVGFGSGATQLQLVVALDDLAAGVPHPFYQSDASATSGGRPGAAVFINPIAMGARFLMSRQDVQKSARKLAQQVSDEVARRAGVAVGK